MSFCVTLCFSFFYNLFYFFPLCFLPWTGNECLKSGKDIFKEEKNVPKCFFCLFHVHVKLHVIRTSFDI